MPIVWKKHTPLENRLVWEYMIKYHPRALQWRRVRLGPYPEQEKSKLYSVLRRWADCVFVENKTVYILEAKMRAEPGAIGQLELYKKLFPDTPEFYQFRKYPIKLIFLTTIRDKVVEKLCKEKGIQYIVYSPAWVKEWWKKKMGAG